MAVRASIYMKVGGMNTRKAGEDFYFLQKVIARGQFANLDTTCIYPSARISDRVPFGTGRAVGEMLSGKQLLTYNPESYVALKAFLDRIAWILDGESFDKARNDLSEPVQSFLDGNGFDTKLSEIRQNASSSFTRLKRFYAWFNGFRVMKFLHYAHACGYDDVHPDKAWEWLSETVD